MANHGPWCDCAACEADRRAPRDPRLPIATVGDLIDALERFDRDEPVRLLVRPGELGGVQDVQNIGGRVTLRPAASAMVRRRG